MDVSIHNLNYVLLREVVYKEYECQRMHAATLVLSLLGQERAAG